ncbi:hypothetical protein M9H77_35685 [Catharanthus roseus]|uniref:Uncharacterized protein n=1 Tax=Catharanthus roseus TaxID=4058 RepID=A0ACB9ZQH3_CATRO|nr:hypothetical protein M9H77_35685 [Catharanthus roseus]
MRRVSLIFSVGVSVVIYSSVTVQAPLEVLSYPNDEYIRWYRGITRVYIGNQANRDTHSVGYQPAGVDRRNMTSMLQEVDDIVSVVIQEPSSSPSYMAIFAKKVQTIIRRCISKRWMPPVPPFPSRPRYADPGHVEMERGEGSRQVERGEGSGGGHPLVDPFDNPNLDIPSFSLGLTQPFQSLPGGSGTLRAPPLPGLGFSLFQSPAGTSLRFSSFCAPPPPSTVGSSTPHQPISQASSSDDEEQTDDTDDVQCHGFGHRVGKKITSQWFSSARYDYTHSGAFLDMGSGSPIDDLVESGTIRLLDWNDSITDIQLGMRFVDKVQAISADRKWSISMGREY